MTAPPLQISEERRRRRRLRLIPVIGYAIVALGLAWFLQMRLPTTVIVVRHADTDTTMAQGGDPPLNARGRARAEHLADFLQDIDVVAGVDVIYATPARRTQETAQPLADRLGLTVNINDDPYRMGRFRRQMLRAHRGDIVLVVTHGDAIPLLIDELHGSKRLPPYASDVYDNVYIVTIPWWGGVKTLRLHYGEPPLEAEASSATAAPLTSTQ